MCWCYQYFWATPSYNKAVHAKKWILPDHNNITGSRIKYFWRRHFFVACFAGGYPQFTERMWFDRQHILHAGKILCWWVCETLVWLLCQYLNLHPVSRLSFQNAGYEVCWIGNTVVQGGVARPKSCGVSGVPNWQPSAHTNVFVLGDWSCQMWTFGYIWEK